MQKKINWISSQKHKNFSSLTDLANNLENFYSVNKNYYAEIDFTEGNWVNKEEPLYIEIINSALKADKILEIGCGSANILKHCDIQQKYTGIDFSKSLLANNKVKYPAANFTSFTEYNRLSFENNLFDFVFSVFVIEHTVFPLELIKEMERVTKPGGTLIILCPDFLGRNRITSQLSGITIGPGREKLRKGKILDSLLTAWDNKIKIFLNSVIRKLAIKYFYAKGFYINLNPVCFHAAYFEPDFDAVYLTYKYEIEKFLSNSMQMFKNDKIISKDEKNKKLIFIKCKKIS